MATIAINPVLVTTNRHMLQSLNLVLVGAGWVQGTTVFTLSGVAGVALVVTIVNSTGLARLAITTGATAGTLTISDGTNSGTVTIKPRPPARRKWFPGLEDRRPR